MKDRSTLQALSQGRWFIPLLAEIGTDGARSAQLRRSLGLSASMASRSLAAMEAAGWISRNPGHGHPLRPEWVATRAGAALIPDCREIAARRAEAGMRVQDGGRWHLPILAELADGEKRFTELQQRLPPVTPRALSQSLQRGVALGHIDRTLEPDFPPVSFYAVAERMRPLAVAAGAVG